MANPRGFTLLEVMIAVVLLLVLSVLVLRVGTDGSRAVALGRRWTAMARAAEDQLGRLELAYRSGRPRCAVPAGGSGYTPDGVGLAWSVVGDSVTAQVVLEVRALTAGRPLLDSLHTTLSCR